nr:immunoglobulin light chain junction region [Homo sapiens]
CSLKTGLRVF